MILTGLPRTGRSVLARTIAGEQGGLMVDAAMPDGQAVLADIGTAPSANVERLIVIDAIATGTTPLVISAVRAAAEARTPPRFLLLAADASSASSLRDGLIGVATQVELPTIRIEEDLEGSRPLTLGHVDKGQPQLD